MNLVFDSGGEAVASVIDYDVDNDDAGNEVHQESRDAEGGLHQHISDRAAAEGFFALFSPRFSIHCDAALFWFSGDFCVILLFLLAHLLKFVFFFCPFSSLNLLFSCAHGWDLE